jgi:hypothetical protein
MRRNQFCTLPPSSPKTRPGVPPEIGAVRPLPPAARCDDEPVKDGPLSEPMTTVARLS